MTAPLVRLTNVNKSFGGVKALKAVSFELRSGEVHALVGENGAGKTTLVKLITGALQPDAGTMEVNGGTADFPRRFRAMADNSEETSSRGDRLWGGLLAGFMGQSVQRPLKPAQARQLGIACIYQQPALFPDLTVAENVALRLEAPSTLRRIDWRRRRERARQLLGRVGADISPEALVRDLSMPHQQLVEIACAVGAEARVVIMDEPTASLTQREQHLLFAVVRDLKERGAGVVYVSHRLEEVFALADRVTVLRDGENVRTCAANELNESSLIHLMVGRELPLTRPTAVAAGVEVVLSLREVRCSLSGVRDISLDLRAGEILGLAAWLAPDGQNSRERCLGLHQRIPGRS